MARIALGADMHGGRGPTVYHTTDPVGAGADALADEAAVSADITAALAVTAIANDATATTAVTLIQTDFATLVTDLAAGGGVDPAVLLSVDTSVVTDINSLRSIVLAMLNAVEFGSDDY